MEATLYLIPVSLGDTAHNTVFPSLNCEIIKSLRYFIVENIRTARRFLKKTAPDIVIDELIFSELNEHTKPVEIASLLFPVESGNSVGLMSEAGCPAVADPGAALVALAHKKGFRVKPLVGPSSILLALMSSGFNGQRFAFTGYPPTDTQRCTAFLKQCEKRLIATGETQIFIETPYRNNKLLEQLIVSCQPDTQLCIAADMTCTDETVITKSIGEWKHNKPDLNKHPAVFIIGQT
jgi:16S rRNA (cytidine1402-2'-O)-methyltransferase